MVVKLDPLTRTARLSLRSSEILRHVEEMEKSQPLDAGAQA